MAYREREGRRELANLIFRRSICPFFTTEKKKKPSCVTQQHAWILRSIGSWLNSKRENASTRTHYLITALMIERGRSSKARLIIITSLLERVMDAITTRNIDLYLYIHKPLAIESCKQVYYFEENNQQQNILTLECDLLVFRARNLISSCALLS